MRLMKSKSTNAVSLYVIKSVYENGRRTTKIVEKLGTAAELAKKLGSEDPVEWAKQYIEKLNKMEREGTQPDVVVKYSPDKFIDADVRRCFNGGYLFLSAIYHALGLHKICSSVSRKHSFSYDLDAVLSRLVYGRIIFPNSKLATYSLAEKFIEQPHFELQHVYRALDVLTKASDFIQSSLFNNSRSLLGEGRSGVVYYDCTNFYFETETECGDRRYGVSKEHRPNPIVQMGMFMDAKGIPLAFCISPGNTNEQLTLEPLEKKLLTEFKMSKLVVCTDAGLSSIANRRFNDVKDRAFVTTQSLKKLKKYIREWALSPEGWRIAGDKRIFNIHEIEETQRACSISGMETECPYHDKVFYKERGIKENGLEQKLIVTYSIKYRNYQRCVRGRQIDRAVRAMEAGTGKLDRYGANDYRRFVSRKKANGSEKEKLTLNHELIEKEEMYDGFYGVCSNLDDKPETILKIMHWRWEIEESFRIMKSEFRARPVYLRRDDRIKAHFLTCFISLLIYRLLERKLDYKYTCSEILSGLREMNFLEIKGEGYVPLYKRTSLTDTLHEKFGFRTDRQIVSSKTMKEIVKQVNTNKTILTF